MSDISVKSVLLNWRRHIGVMLIGLPLLSGVGVALAQNSVRLGFHAPLTGFAAADGKSARLGAELAVEQINASGGINGRKLEMIVYDDGGKAEEGVQVANRLNTQDRVTAVVSGALIPAPLVLRHQLLFAHAYRTFRPTRFILTSPVPVTLPFVPRLQEKFRDVRGQS